MNKKQGRYTYNNVTFIYDGVTKNGRSYAVKLCPQCNSERRVTASQVNNIRSGRSQGLCQNCLNIAIGNANRGRLSLNPDETLPCGSILHWSSRTHKGKVMVTCGSCSDQRMRDLGIRYSKTGLCMTCTNALSSLEAHPGWKGGILKDEKYILRHIGLYTAKELEILLPMKRKSGYVLEHRAIMALHLQRPLDKEEIVHHKNGIKDDNRLENLMLTTPQDHANKEVRTLQDEIKRLRTLLRTQ